MAGWDRQLTEDDAADISKDNPKSIKAVSFFLEWPDRKAEIEGVLASNIVSSTKTQSLVPFSTIAYEKYTAKNEKDNESKDGAQQITVSATAILAAAYALSF